MRVLLATSQFAPELGGVPRLLWQFCTHLPEDMDLRVLSVRQRPAGDYAAFDSASHVQVERVPPLPGAGFTSLRFAIRLGLQTLRWHPDIILCGVAYPTAIMAGWVSRITGVPFVVYAHSEDVTVRQRRDALASALQNAAKVITVSEFTKKNLLDLGVPTEKITIIHPGVDAAKFDTPARNAPEFGLLTVARLVLRKGQDTVIRALPQIAAAVPNVKYRIVGGGPDEEPLRALVAELGVDEYVEFLGYPSDDEVVVLYQAADIYIMPTRFDPLASEVEGFGIVFLEANAAHKAVIAGKSGGVADAVLHEETGLLVDPLDVDAVAKAVIRLATDDAFREKLAENGYQRVLHDFSVQGFADKVVGVLKANLRLKSQADRGSLL